MGTDIGDSQPSKVVTGLASLCHYLCLEGTERSKGVYAWLEWPEQHAFFNISLAFETSLVLL